MELTSRLCVQKAMQFICGTAHGHLARCAQLGSSPLAYASSFILYTLLIKLFLV